MLTMITVGAALSVLVAFSRQRAVEEPELTIFLLTRNPYIRPLVASSITLSLCLMSGVATQGLELPLCVPVIMSVAFMALGYGFVRELLSVSVQTYVDRLISEHRRVCVICELHRAWVYYGVISGRKPVEAHENCEEEKKVEKGGRP
jgi:hypothetical protein